MPEILDGEMVEVQGSAKDPYILRNTGGVLSCSCPAWRNQSAPIEKRTCKHLRNHCGEAEELARLGGELPERARKPRPVAVVSASGVVSSESAEAASTEPALLLAHSWTTDVDLSGWWMSEKLDGVRAYWDGRQFISRQGNVYQAPDWFIEDLPTDVHLDGELWLSRKGFQRAVSIVRRQDKSEHWKEITYLVFDAPLVDAAFEGRVAYLHELLGKIGPKYARAHEHERCENIDHLKRELARVEALGGEGLMLRKPGSRYERGRSYTLLKVKSFHDAEARVVGHLEGAGKHKGRLGALSVELGDGTSFSVGTGFSDAQRENPPPIGSIITFRYQELSDRGVPRFPSFVRLRTDVTELPLNLEHVPAAARALNNASAQPGVKAPSAVMAAGTQNRTVAEAVPAGSAMASAVSKAVPESLSSSPVSQAVLKAVAPHAVTAAGNARHFAFVEGTSSKFWEISLHGSTVNVRFVHEEPKSFASPAAAKTYYDDLILEKTKNGYVESGSVLAGEVDLDDGDEAPPRPAPVAKPSSIAHQTAAIARPATPMPASTPPSAPHAMASNAGARRFEFEEGTSSKFWEIRMSGSTVTVKFGRIGTVGQEKPKEFPSPAAAKRYYDDLILEKTKKGYEEIGGGPADDDDDDEDDDDDDDD